MSELIQKHDSRATIRWKLLTGASALALIASAPAMAGDDADHPLIWIELGANADMVSGFGDRFTAPFLEQTPTPTPFRNGSPVELQKPPRFTFGGDGKVSFQPEDSNWIFSASIRYDRSNNNRAVHHQTGVTISFSNPLFLFYRNRLGYSPDFLAQHGIFPTKTKTAQKFSDTKVQQSERHTVLDFEAGKDVGLGLFGHGGTSVLSAGVRMARFKSHSAATIRANPDITHYTHLRFGYPTYYSNWDDYYLRGQANRSFSGIGPSLSWRASLPFAGNTKDGELSLDWGINGAALFGRQRAKVSHQTTKLHHVGRFANGTAVPTSVFGGSHHTLYIMQYQNQPPGQNRSRNVTVPNVGASIGISYRIEDAKLSIGYRTDNFFGAMDGGIDRAKRTTLGFNGLYASISIGLAD